MKTMFCSIRRLVRIAPAVLVLAAGIAASACTDSRSAGSSGSDGQDERALSFTDITAAAGLADFQHVNGSFGQKWVPEIASGGGGFIDYDGDRWPDILLVGGGKFREYNDGPVRALYLYRNNGDGTFSDRTEKAGLADVLTYGMGITAADYDNDGDEDFFLSTLYEDMLFRNDGGTFVEVGAEAGIAERSEWSSSSLFFDADNDGYVDLYVGGYIDWTPAKDIYCPHNGEKAYCTPQQYDGIASRFYHNNGDGTFTDRTDEAGFTPIPGKVYGAVELDYNNDGWSDLYIAEDTERNLLYVNNGDGTFTERGVAAGVAYDQNGRARAGMGADAGVVDSTMQVTLFVGNFSEETVGAFRHMGGGLFVDRVAPARLAYPSMLTLTFGLFLFDVDLDGDLDLFTANGHVQTHISEIHERVTFEQPSQLYLNRGDGVFDEVSQQHDVLMQPVVGRGAAYADVDRDGDLDILLIENDGPAHLWRNDLEDGRFLRVSLEGRESNRDALGSRLVLVADGQRMERRIRTGSSYLSQSETAAVFGLGASERVDSLLVFWPGGHVDRFADLEANQEIRVIEGTGMVERAPLPGRTLRQEEGQPLVNR